MAVQRRNQRGGERRRSFCLFSLFLLLVLSAVAVHGVSPNQQQQQQKQQEQHKHDLSNVEKTKGRPLQIVMPNELHTGNLTVLGFRV